MTTMSHPSLSEEDLDRLLAELRTQKTDNERVEAKSARKGLPKSIWDTVSAFATTRGGIILLGVDEKDNFSVNPDLAVERYSNMLIAGLEDRPGQSPQVTPSPTYRLGTVQVEGCTVLALEIDSLLGDPRKAGMLPCHVKNKGIRKGSFKRVFDHDQLLSTYEIHELQARSGKDNTDRQPVDEANLEDLNSDAVSGLINRMKAQGSRIAEGSPSREEVLSRLNVLSRSDGEAVPTLAGILTLGWYPQQFYPQLFIDVTVHPGTEKSTGADGIRFDSRRLCDGPMPAAIETAVTEVLSQLRTRFREEGASVVEEPEIPVIAIREAIANAVMHRDYGDYVTGQQITVDIYSDRVEIINPGGLWGDRTLENLGENRSVSRNEVLAKLLSQVADGEGHKVAENQGSGIQRMVGALREFGLPTPSFQDEIGFFKVTLYRFGLISPEVRRWLDSLPGARTRTQEVALALAQDLGAVTVTNLRDHLRLDSDDARRELQELEEQGWLRADGADHYLASTPTPDLGETQQAILDVLSRSESMSARDIAAATGKSVSSIRPHLRELIELGLASATAPPTSRNRAYLRT